MSSSFYDLPHHNHTETTVLTVIIRITQELLFFSFHQYPPDQHSHSGSFSSLETFKSISNKIPQRSIRGPISDLMTPWPRGLLRGSLLSPSSWRLLEAAGPLARPQFHSHTPSQAYSSRNLTTGPVHTPQRPGEVSRRPLTSRPPRRAGMVLDPSSPSENHDEFASTYDLVPAPHHSTPPSPLSVLPLKVVLRSLFVSAVSSSKPLLPPSLYLMSILASSTTPLLSPSKNPLLGFLVRKVVYDQFCAGETPREVDRAIAGLKDLGYSGVMLCYAKEIEREDSRPSDVQVKQWTKGMLETIALAQAGDFVALKLTGAGREALSNLARRRPPPPAIARSIDTICALAASRGVRLLFDAEQAAIQDGIDDWT